MSCNCGCNTCNIIKETKLLREGTKYEPLISEALEFHITNKIPLYENIFRIYSDGYFGLINEVRSLYNDKKIQLSESDEHLIKTDIGKMGVYEGQLVPLDVPMVGENKYQSINEDIEIYGNLYESLDINNSYNIDKIDNTGNMISFIFKDKHGIKRMLRLMKDNSIKVLWFDENINRWSLEDVPSKYEDEKVINTFGKIIINIILPKFKSIHFIPTNMARYRLFRAFIYNNLDTSIYNLEFNDDTLEINVNQILNEAEYKGKDVDLNKPKRGGSKAYYVYVKDPKTKKVKKVSFGSGGLRAKIKNKKARTAFAKRHNCDKKKDRTKAGYWSCNLPRYAKSLGLGSNMNTYW
jgi:hypothetical protein